MNVTLKPITERITKDIFKLVAPATKPIIGGPIKSPTKPSVDTAAIATPGLNLLDFLFFMIGLP